MTDFGLAKQLPNSNLETPNLELTLSGQVLTLPLPLSGKLIEVQAFFRNRWRTFSTTRAQPMGGWTFDYQFGGTRGRVPYRLRVRLPAEGGYPFDTGSSRTARVVVTGPN